MWYAEGVRMASKLGWDVGDNFASSAGRSYAHEFLILRRASQNAMRTASGTTITLGRMERCAMDQTFAQGGTTRTRTQN